MVLLFATLYDALIILMLAGMSKPELLDGLVFYVPPVMLMPKLSYHLSTYFITRFIINQLYFYLGYCPTNVNNNIF